MGFIWWRFIEFVGSVIFNFYRLLLNGKHHRYRLLARDLFLYSNSAIFRHRLLLMNVIIAHITIPLANKMFFFFLPFFNFILYCCCHSIGSDVPSTALPIAIARWKTEEMNMTRVNGIDAEMEVSHKRKSTWRSYNNGPKSSETFKIRKIAFFLKCKNIT